LLDWQQQRTELKANRSKSEGGILAKGHVALVVGDHRLYGKISDLDEQTCEVEFFLSVAVRKTERYPRKRITHAHLQKQTRVFVQKSSGIWRVGRVRSSAREEDGSFSYEIRFPNGLDAEFNERDLHVRCLDEFSDPAETLAAGCAETQYFADRRRKALDRLIALRGAARGLTGMLSSAVELVPHQVSAVRRVLTDTTQRYLLADEVGLGKTVEAGAIARQLLIDRSVEKVVFLVPDNLITQWDDELQRKFFLSEFSDAEVEIIGHSQAGTISIEHPPDLLVIDEAHRVVTTAQFEPTPAQSIHIRKIASAAARLLLLSATPGLADETQFLGILNLLDPAAFPLYEPDRFKLKVEKRQEIGRFLLAFRPGANIFVLKQQAQSALVLFSSDTFVKETVEKLLSAVQAGKLIEDFVLELRDHVARTYRIHQRIVRSRRSDIEGWAMWPRGPRSSVDDGVQLDLRHVRFEFNRSDEMASVWNTIEAWRDDALNASRKSNSLEAALANRCVALYSYAMSGSSALNTLVQSEKELFSGERDLLNAIGASSVSTVGSDDRYAAIASALLDWRGQQPRLAGRSPQKIACFCSDHLDALKLTEHLTRSIGSGYVACAFNSSLSATADLIGAFELDGTKWILVCDSESEEGVNLQFVHTIFHVDLPMSPARLEQRIGRLDRFGRRINGVFHRVLLPVDDEESPWRAWFDLLANGFQIFTRSVSDVQFLLDKLQIDIANALFQEGAAGLARIQPQVQADIARERTKLDEQGAIDSLSLFHDSGADFVKELEQIEDDEDAIREDIVPWMSEVLGIHHLRQIENSEIVRLHWSEQTLLPTIPWKGFLASGLDRASTWKRAQSGRRGRNSVALLRPGSQAIDSLERISRWDDRGIAYSTWRFDPSWKRPTWRGFRLVWQVEPSCGEPGPLYHTDGDSELLRRAESFLKTERYEQVFDESGAEVTDSQVLAAVRRRYSNRYDESGRRDINLGSRFGEQRKEMDSALLENTIHFVRDSAYETLVRSELYVTRVSAALEMCKVEMIRARGSLHQRALIHVGESGIEPMWLKSELDRLVRLENAVRIPHIRLDEIGFLIISGTQQQAEMPI
jgi:ATP-dependent helicase HepA